MFVDQVSVYVKAGDGGDGLAAYRREIYVPKGGPAGGDGGHGGDVIFKVDEGLNTLMDFRYNRHFKAKRGENGMSKNKHGKNSDPLVVAVPPGTTVMDSETDDVLADLTTHQQEAVIAKGGRGGRGNTRFATPRNPAPELSENGEPGQERTIKVELKVIADVGLVGFPSVGKSTLLSTISAAKPKIADYHFTTLAPNLGVIDTQDQRSFVIADLPGLMEGAHEGVGLGYQFLRHIERTRVILHVVDMAGTEERDPYADWVKINQELEAYDPKLMERPQIIAANKMDMPGAEENLQKFKATLRNNDSVYPISAVTKQGLQDMLYAIADTLDDMPAHASEPEEDADKEVVYRYHKEETPFTVTKDPDGAFVLSGPRVEKLYKMTDFTQDEAVQRFARQLRKIGVDDELRQRGAQDGDIIRLLETEFEFMD
ncbi:GTPase ObgE [Lentibacillus halophilus]|uniref:GTPase Obg n=1 Tax=Lentibacillus halophilus TaxID=295065 RepID=A0ABP3J5I7_9BACI